MEHPTRPLAGWTGILQPDAYGGHNGVYDAARKPAPVLSAQCWSHARRKFFELDDTKATAGKGTKVAEEVSLMAAGPACNAMPICERQATSGPGRSGWTGLRRAERSIGPLRPCILDGCSHLSKKTFKQSVSKWSLLQNFWASCRYGPFGFS